VIGVGSRHGGDDGVGLELARRVAEHPARGALRVHALDGDPLALLAALEGLDAVLLCDAVRSAAPAGTIHRARADQAPLPALARRSSSTHHIGLSDTIELARTLGRLPRRTVVYGIEGANFESGAPLSPPCSTRSTRCSRASWPNLTGFVRPQATASAAGEASSSAIRAGNTASPRRWP
jgi:hydrogenase maturation protease